MKDQLSYNKVNILSVVGTTSSGKTDFVLKLSEKVLENNEYSEVVILSADSKQVYKGLEILTGADIPQGFSHISVANDFINDYDFFVKKLDKTDHNIIRLCGISIIEAKSEWSVAHFQEYAHKLIDYCYVNNALLICVGGTGLYQRQLMSYDRQLYIKPNVEVRQKARDMSVGELQKWLKELDPDKLSNMNNSDINNSRRLVRAIEVSIAKSPARTIIEFDQNSHSGNMVIREIMKKCNYKIIGLEADFNNLEDKIKIRVMDRIKQGALSEVENLSSKLNSDDQAFTAIGFVEIVSFLKKETNQDELIKLWSLHEYQYAKKQLLWWKNQPDILWLDDSKKTSYTLNK